MMTVSARTTRPSPHSPTTYLVASIIIAILIWLPRGLALDRFVTADEHAWLARSGNFYRALANGNYAETFQRHHPGVVVTWAGTLGFLQTDPAYAQDAPHQFGWLTEEIEPFLKARGHDPVDVLAAGRGYVVLIISLSLLLSFLLATRLIGLLPALIGFGLIALDPFHIGLSRLLHLDGLLSSLMFLSLLAFLHFQQSQHRSSLILSAVAAALAWLTRSPGLFLLPFLTLLIVGDYFGITLLDYRDKERSERIVNRQWRKRPLRELSIIPPLLWLFIAAFTFALLWPAMWVDPIGSVTQVLGAASTYAAEGHLKPTFFNGQVISGDPGLLFYPISYLWRTTPLALIGLALALVGLFLGRGIWAERGVRNTALVLLLYGLLFGAFMNIGAKKFDRYLLPIYPALNLVAGMGLVGIAQLVLKLRSDQPAFEAGHSAISGSRLVGLILLVVLLFVQAGQVISTYPYYLSYYNPLLGGADRAPEVMQIGWGEGADQAGRLLAEEQDAAEKVVASAYTNGPFSYFYPGQTLPITFWHQADYAVLYAQDFQRRLPSPRQIRYFEGLEPRNIVAINGLEYARIYAMHGALLPSYVTDWHAEVNRQDLHPLIRLVSYQLPSSQLMPGESLPLTFYFQGLEEIDANLNVIVRLVDGAGNEVAREEGWPWGSPTSGWQSGDVWPDGHVFVLPEPIVPGPLRVDIAFNNPEQGELLQATRSQTGEALGEWLQLDFVTIGGTLEGAAVLESPPPALGDLVQFNGFTPRIASDSPLANAKIEARAGDVLTLDLFWETLAHMDIDYTVFVHVVGADGQMLVQSDQQPMGGFYPTSFWQRGRTTIDYVSLGIPADAASGVYPIYVGMYEPATVERLAVSRGGVMVGDAIQIGELVVVP